MSDTSYRIIFQGIADGFNVEGVKERLANLFKVTPEKIDLLFTGKSVVLKSGLDKASALRFKSILEKVGAVCRIEALEKNTKPQKTMICPKCGFKQQESNSCVHCGIIIDKYEELRRKKEEKEHLVQASTPATKKVSMTIHSALFAKFTGLVGTKFKIIGMGVAVIIGLLTVLEFVYLRGDLVTRGSINIANEDSSLAIMVDQPLKQYLVDVSLTGRKKRKLSFLLEDRTGKVIYKDAEYYSHKGSRTFTFKPKEKGIYKLYVNPGVTVFGERGYARVRVYVNDRRILTRVFGWLNF